MGFLWPDVAVMKDCSSLFHSHHYYLAAFFCKQSTAVHSSFCFAPPLLVILANIMTHVSLRFFTPRVPSDPADAACYVWTHIRGVFSNVTKGFYLTSGGINVFVGVSDT